jgi:hypothetical protein
MLNQAAFEAELCLPRSIGQLRVHDHGYGRSSTGRGLVDSEGAGGKAARAQGRAALRGIGSTRETFAVRRPG